MPLLFKMHFPTKIHTFKNALTITRRSSWHLKYYRILSFISLLSFSILKMTNLTKKVGCFLKPTLGEIKGKKYRKATSPWKFCHLAIFLMKCWSFKLKRKPQPNFPALLFWVFFSSNKSNFFNFSLWDGGWGLCQSLILRILSYCAQHFSKQHANSNLTCVNHLA